MTPAAASGHFINWFGHAAGAVVFGLFLGLLWRDRSPGRLKAVGATAIALLWNLAELLGLWQGVEGPLLAAFSSSAFSVLPALLFDLVIRGTPVWAVRAGYALSIGGAVLHLGELFSESAALHDAGLMVVAGGFGALGLYAAVLRRRRALPALALLLLALSILHFAQDEPHTAWWVELLVHHAGIPLAMFVLLQDYRFVFLDALIRFLANILVALVFAGAVQAWFLKWPGTALAGSAGLMLLYAFSRVRVQELLTRLVFRRADLSGLLASVRPVGDEASVLEAAELGLMQFFGCAAAAPDGEVVPEGPSLIADGAEAALGVRLHAGALRIMRFGRRAGGRRYMSEDLEALRLVGDKLREALETLRDAELRRLVSEAELRALQAQIHPHFLFNAFNTLYGIIPKEAVGARRTVLNLSELFRYFLETNQTFVSIEKEVGIIQAYLEIEALRLGAKLSIDLAVDPAVLNAKIPLLSIEPLVENAVKHGVAAKASGGTVRVAVRREDKWVRVEVADTGGGFSGDGGRSGGVGLDNVRQRLRLCYGLEADLEIDSSPDGSSVRFVIPYSI
jgi:signal transduction histidine kinase